MPNPPNNNDLQRERVRFLNDSMSLQRVIMRGSMANSSRDNVVAPVIPATPPPTASVTPTPSVTCTVTPTVTLTPTETTTPTVTPTVTTTPTITPTATVTPTVSITPTVTPTITITPTVTPDYSYITLQPLTGLGQDIYISGIIDESQYLPTYNFRDINGLYRAISFQEAQNGNVFTTFKKYQNYEYTSTLFGSSALDSPFAWIYEITNQINPIFPFISPTDLGNTALIPFSGYLSNDVSAPYNVISGVKVYPDYKFSSLFARTTAVSAVIVRGLTGSTLNNSLCSVNGIVLERYISYVYGLPTVEYKSYSTLPDTFYDYLSLYYVDGERCWYLDLVPNEKYNSIFMGFTASPSFKSFQIPFSGFKMRGDILSDQVYFRELSGQINQPNLQLLNANESFQNYPTPTPTPTITVTPTISPTISLTPTITPTISQTPTTSPTTTPTISITPTITPTISITPTITVTVTPTKATPTPTPTSRTDTLPFSSVYLSAFGFYGDMEGVEYGISYDINAPILLEKSLGNYYWQAYYEPYECYISLEGSPAAGWGLYLLQFGEYGFGNWVVATNNQSLSAIPLKNWTLSPGSSGGVIILNG